MKTSTGYRYALERFDAMKQKWCVQLSGDDRETVMTLYKAAAQGSPLLHRVIDRTTDTVIGEAA